MSADTDSMAILVTPADRLHGHAATVGQRVVAQPRRLGWRRKLVIALAVTDAAFVTVALLVAQLVRFRRDGLDASTPQTDVAYLTLGAAIAAVWLVALSATSSRLLRNIGTGTVEYQRVVNATLMTFGLLAMVAYLAQIEIARGYLAVALPLGLVLLLAGRMTWRYVLHSMRRVGRCATGSIVVGRSDDVARVVDELRRQYRVGYRAIGAAYAGSAHTPQDRVLDLPLVDFSRLAETSKRTRTRAVIVAGDSRAATTRSGGSAGSWRTRAPSSSSCRASPTSQARGSISGRSTACRWCTWTCRNTPGSTMRSSAYSTSSWRARRSFC